jgi:NAD(P)H-nitrite reductase large subunit
VIAEKAVLADEHCQTSEAAIYAAGDCAAVRDNLFGRHRVAAQWDTAATTGAIAGANMAGEVATFGDVTHFSTELFGLPVWAWGQSQHLDRRLLRGTPNVESPDFLEFGVAGDGRISFALGVGPHAGDEVLAELVRRRVKINGNEEQLKDPTVALGDLL